MAKYPVDISSFVRRDVVPGYIFLEHIITFADGSKDFISSRFHETTPLHTGVEDLARKISLASTQSVVDFPPNSKCQIAGIAAAPTQAVDITAEQLATLHSSPVELVAAAGLNTVILPVSVVLDYEPGDIPFTGAAQLRLGYDGLFENLVAVGGFLDQTTPQIKIGPAQAQGAKSEVVNHALLLGADADLASGPIVSAVVDAPGGAPDGVRTITLATTGSGLNPNTAFAIGPLGPTSANFQVDTVDGDGAALTFHLLSSGSGSSLQNNVTVTPFSSLPPGAIAPTVNITGLGDLFQIDDLYTIVGGNADAQVRVTGIDGSGRLTSVSLEVAGSYYAPGTLALSAIGSAQGGNTVEAHVTITTTRGNGKIRVIVDHLILHLKD